MRWRTRANVLMVDHCPGATTDTSVIATLASVIFKSVIGTALVIAIPPAVVWLIFALLRWLVL
jgi:hypothetical protein